MITFGMKAAFAIVTLAHAASSSIPAVPHTSSSSSSSIKTESYTVQPLYTAPKPKQRLYLQNNGLCFNAKKAHGSYKVEFSRISNVVEQQMWHLREDGRIMNSEFNQCLSITQRGDMSLCGCDSDLANMWDVNWKQGIFKEKRWNKVIGLNHEKIFFRDYSEVLDDSNLFWTPYVVQKDVPARPPVIITSTIQPNIPISFQHANSYLAVEYRDNQCTVQMTQQPNIFQQQNWMLLPNGRIKNVIYNKCLTGHSNKLSLCDCDDSRTVSEWEYNYKYGSIIEKKSGHAIAYENNSISLQRFEESNFKESMKFSAYEYKAQQMNSEGKDAAATASASSGAKNVVGASALLSFSAGLIFARA
jgi:hypothetical protein